MFEGVCLLVLFFCLYYEDVCLIDGTPLPFEIGCLLNFTFDGILISVFDVAAVVLDFSVHTLHLYEQPEVLPLGAGCRRRDLKFVRFL